MKQRYLNKNGLLKYPFSHISFVANYYNLKLEKSECRALNNLTLFLISLSILLHRLKSHLNNYEKDSWVNIDIYELFLDTQSLFLFIQQFLEDLSLILRRSIPPKDRHQLSPKFSKLSKKLIDILPENNQLKEFLYEKANWFNEIKQIRDDICHRTLFGKKRIAEFPNEIELLRSGGGITNFASAKNLKTYIKTILENILNLSILSDEYIKLNIVQEEDELFRKPGYVLRSDWDNEKIDKFLKKESGIVFLYLEKERYNSIEYFLEQNLTIGER